MAKILPGSEESQNCCGSRGPDPRPKPGPAQVLPLSRPATCKRPGGAAVKRAMGKDKTDYPRSFARRIRSHGVAVMVEAATDKARTVANVRMHFSKGQALGTQRMLAFTFQPHGAKIQGQKTGLQYRYRTRPDRLRFWKEIGGDADNNIIIRTAYNEFGNGKGTGRKNQVISAELTHPHQYRRIIRRTEPITKY